MKDLKRIAAHLGPYGKDLFIAAALVLVETCFELVIPILMADIIDVGVSAGDMALIGRRGIQMAVCALLALVTGLLYARLRPGPPTVWGRGCGRRSTRRFRRILLPIWTVLSPLRW